MDRIVSLDCIRQRNKSCISSEFDSINDCFDGIILCCCIECGEGCGIMRDAGSDTCKINVCCMLDFIPCLFGEEDMASEIFPQTTTNGEMIISDEENLEKFIDIHFSDSFPKACYSWVWIIFAIVCISLQQWFMTKRISHLVLFTALFNTECIEIFEESKDNVCMVDHGLELDCMIDLILSVFDLCNKRDENRSASSFGRKMYEVVVDEILHEYSYMSFDRLHDVVFRVCFLCLSVPYTQICFYVCD